MSKGAGAVCRSCAEPPPSPRSASPAGSSGGWPVRHSGRIEPQRLGERIPPRSATVGLIHNGTLLVHMQPNSEVDQRLEV